MPAGIGGGGYVMFAFETVMGTYVQPDAVGAIAVPILNRKLPVPRGQVPLGSDQAERDDAYRRKAVVLPYRGRYRV